MKKSKNQNEKRLGNKVQRRKKKVNNIRQKRFT